MPTNPESEGSRLITLKQIEQEHGIGRSSLHTYRRRPTFPQPVPVEGSTKIVYDAAEVTAWFEANPPQQGKRTDLAPDEGADMATTPQAGQALDSDIGERMAAMLVYQTGLAAQQLELPEGLGLRVADAVADAVQQTIEEWRP